VAPSSKRIAAQPDSAEMYEYTVQIEPRHGAGGPMKSNVMGGPQSVCGELALQFCFEPRGEDVFVTMGSKEAPSHVGTCSTAISYATEEMPPRRHQACLVSNYFSWYRRTSLTQSSCAGLEGGGSEPTAISDPVEGLRGYEVYTKYLVCVGRLRTAILTLWRGCLSVG